MEDFKDSLTFDLTGKTHYALIAFLRKHGADTDDISRFIESAVIWRIFDREMAIRHATNGEAVDLFSGAPDDGPVDSTLDHDRAEDHTHNNEQTDIRPRKVRA